MSTFGLNLQLLPILACLKALARLDCKYTLSSEQSLVGATSKGSSKGSYEPAHCNRSTVQPLYNTPHYNTDLNITKS